MGWSSISTYHLESKDAKGVKKYLTEQWNRDSNFEVVDYSKKGNTVYMAIKRIDKDIVFAYVTLIGFENGEFFYKEMDESMCPYKFDCPKRLLNKLSDTDNEYALKWRKMCEEHQSKTKRKVEHGDIIQFKETIEFTNGYTTDKLIVVKSGKTVRFGRYKEGFDYCKFALLSQFRITKWNEKDFEIIGNVLV